MRRTSECFLNVIQGHLHELFYSLGKFICALLFIYMLIKVKTPYSSYMLTWIFVLRRKDNPKVMTLLPITSFVSDRILFFFLYPYNLFLTCPLEQCLLFYYPRTRLVKATVFPVVRYGCESWTVKKAECRRIDAFELWCWRRLLRVLWTARRSNQSILKEIIPGHSLEGMMLKLKLQYFGHLMWRVDSLEKTLMLGGIWGRRRRGWQRMR